MGRVLTARDALGPNGAWDAMQRPNDTLRGPFGLSPSKPVHSLLANKGRGTSRTRRTVQAAARRGFSTSQAVTIADTSTATWTMIGRSSEPVATYR